MIKQLFQNLKLIPDNFKDNNVTKCFLHNEINGKSLLLNFKKGYYKCYGKCNKVGSIIDLLLDLGEGIPPEYLFKLNEINEKIDNDKIEAKIIELQTIKNKFKYNQKIKNDKWFIKRGLQLDFIERNYIYYSDFMKRVYIPAFCNNECYGYIKRSIYNNDTVLKKIQSELKELYNIEYSFMEIDMMMEESDSITAKYNELYKKYRWDLKYLNDKTLPKRQIIYEPLTNDPINNRIVLLTEGSFDSIYANQFGYDSFAIIGGGITKDNLYNTDIKLVDYIHYKAELNNQELILCFDNDQAGIKFTKQLRKLSNRIVRRVDWSLLNDPDGKIKDLQYVNKEQLDYLVKNATLY